MKTLFNVITWVGVTCLAIVALLFFQCPVPPTITPLPTASSPASGVGPAASPVPSATPAVASRPRWANLPAPPHPLPGHWSGVCPGVSYYVGASMPDGWQAGRRTDGSTGFVVRSSDGRNGLAYRVGQNVDGAPPPDFAGFPWSDDAELGLRLAQRGIQAQATALAEVIVFGSAWPAYFWQGEYTPPEAEMAGLAPRASHGRYRVRSAAGGESAGFITIIPYGQDFLEIVGFADPDAWEDQALYLSAVLASMEAPPQGWSLSAIEALSSDPTAGWSSTMSTSSNGPGFSASYPPEWEPGRLQGGDGLQFTSPDGQAVAVARVHPSGDPAALLGAWQAPQLTSPTVEDGEPLALLGGEWPSQVARGVDGAGVETTARVAFAQAGEYVLEALVYAPSGEVWDGTQETFDLLLASVQVWKTEYDAQHGLQVSYPAGWTLAPAPGGEGLWASAPDGSQGLVLWVRESSDPAALLAAWDGASLSGVGDFSQVRVEEGRPVFLMRTEQPSRSWQAQDGSNTAVQGSVTAVEHGDTVLEIVWYAPVEQWDRVQKDVFSRLNTLIMAP